MRTWSVSGTALALCTRSSSLSMRTRTSMGLSGSYWWGRRGTLLLRADRRAGTPVGVQLAEALGDCGRYELVDTATERRDLLDAARRDEAELGTGHDVQRLDVRREEPVQLVHLRFPLEVGEHTQAFDHRARVVLACELDDEFGEHIHRHVMKMRERVLEERDALLQGEHRLLVVRIADDTDDDLVEDRGGASDYVDVAVRDGVVRAWADGGGHGRKRVIRAEP